MARDYAKTRSPRRGKDKPKRSGGQGGANKKDSRLWILAGILSGLFVVGLLYLKIVGNASMQPLMPNLAVTNAVTSTPTSTSAQVAKPTPPPIAPPPPRFDFANGNSQTQPSNSVAPAVNTSATPSAPATSVPPPPSSPPAAAPATNPSSSVNNASNPPSTSATPAAGDNSAQVANLEKQQLEQESNQATSPTSSVASKTLTYALQLGVFQNYAGADQLKAQSTLQGFSVKIKAVKVRNQTWYQVWMGPYKTKADAIQKQQLLQQNQLKSTLIKIPATT